MATYLQQVKEGKLHLDTAQLHAVTQLDVLYWKLVDYDPSKVRCCRVFDSLYVFAVCLQCRQS